MTDSQNPEISVVIPVYNEEKNIESLYEELSSALNDIGLTYEVIVIDDGSKDNSFKELKKVHERDSRWQVIQFRRNFGQTAGFSAGFDYAKGETIITIDADLQNDPRDIPILLAKMEEGYDIVSGWRVDRKEPFLSRRLPSMTANRLMSWMTGVHLHDYGCSLKAYSNYVAKNVQLYGELHRFLPALAKWLGVEVTEVPVNDRARKFGKSKYGISRTFRVFIDLLTVSFLLGYSTRPAHVFGMTGLGFSGAGILIGIYLTFYKFITGAKIGSRPLLLLAILLIILGVQMVVLGLLAEMVTRTYYESQNKRIYTVREHLKAETDQE